MKAKFIFALVAAFYGVAHANEQQKVEEFLKKEGCVFGYYLFTKKSNRASVEAVCARPKGESGPLSKPQCELVKFNLINGKKLPVGEYPIQANGACTKEVISKGSFSFAWHGSVRTLKRDVSLEGWEAYVSPDEFGIAPLFYKQVGLKAPKQEAQ